MKAQAPSFQYQNWPFLSWYIIVLWRRREQQQRKMNEVLLIFTCSIVHLLNVVLRWRILGGLQKGQTLACTHTHERVYMFFALFVYTYTLIVYVFDTFWWFWITISYKIVSFNSIPHLPSPFWMDFWSWEKTLSGFSLVDLIKTCNTVAWRVELFFKKSCTTRAERVYMCPH